MRRAQAKSNQPTEVELQEAFAQAVVNEDILFAHLQRTFKIPNPGKYPHVMALTQAFLDGEIPRFHADPMVPISIWTVWRSLHDAGKVYDRKYNSPPSAR